MPVADVIRLLNAVALLLVAVAAVVVLVRVAMLLDSLREKLEQRWPSEKRRESQ